MMRARADELMKEAAELDAQVMMAILEVHGISFDPRRTRCVIREAGRILEIHQQEE